ncbi:hypothetical protein JM83_0750 [Gillisia sp. Hel_I_86]|uniref:hypothetical protein n=1 Tax=Gillisia sp. Hel_I_86 TaxID=1249981 RepID=UPI00119C18A7|nr:hypothetical protein [Gillisia sp. Hel_I_86]TVZ25819.1 hypothetical protein JM83_0750 [Gillisia sp. Hel_I_86]
MKKLLLFLCVMAVFFSCSSDSPDEELPEIEDAFNVSLTPSQGEVSVDVPFIIKVQSNEAIYEITRLNENITQSISAAFPDQGLDDQYMNLNIHFEELGLQKLTLEFTSISGKKVSKVLNFEVVRGNAIKITGFKINSFYNMHGTWDQEFASDDPNRLADIIYAFQKLSTTHFSDPKQNMRRWYLSPVYPNEQQLEWDLSQEGLYISDRSILEFGIGDDDGNGIGEDLTRSYQGLRIRLNDYRDTKPAQINLSNEEAGIDISLELEWP